MHDFLFGKQASQQIETDVVLGGEKGVEKPEKRRLPIELRGLIRIEY